MKVRVGNRSLSLAEKDLLGAGGEARVYRAGDLALKIYHPADPAQRGAEEALRLKLEKLRAFPKNLPAEVIAPLEPVTDPQGRWIGYAMRALSGVTEVMHLGRRQFREGVISGQEVSALFLRMHGVLVKLHGAQVIAGDLNDGNVLFAGLEPYFIDADSMQYGGYLCPVAHERFLDPRLYGKDLAGTALFDEGSDWYAFTVMLFASLLYVHPYGGTHPQYPTPLRRAEASWSVLRADVKYPKSGISPRILPDELIARFERVFDGGERGRFPAQLLALRWTRCRCGLEHARPVCPECDSKGVIVVRPAVRHHGACRAIRIAGTRGRILCAVMQGNLKYLLEEDGVVRREDGARVMEEAPLPGMRFAISGRTTWIGHGKRLIAVERERVKARAETETFEGVSSFDAGEDACFRIQNEWLLADRPGTDLPVRLGRILEGQTWFRAGEHLGFGFYRAGLVTLWFIFRPGRPGFTDVRLAPIRGHIAEVSAVFDEGHVLFTLAVELAGKRRVFMYLLDARGTVLGKLEGAPEDHRALASARGKCVAGGRMLAATEDGLVSLEVDRASGSIVERTLFEDTEPFVSLGAELLPGPNGSVYVVTTKEICELVLA